MGGLIGPAGRQYAASMQRTVVAFMVVASAALTAHAAWTPEIDKALGQATYVYVQSERKTGEWSKPAEIWFYVEGGCSTSARGPHRGA